MNSFSVTSAACLHSDRSMVTTNHSACNIHTGHFFGISPTSGPEQVKDREYLGTVNAIYLNADYAAVLFEGKVQLHLASTRHIDSSQNRRDLRTHSY